MAEETKPAPSRHRLEKLTEDYIGERRKRRGESVRRILGMPVAPETTVSEMAEFNKAMAMHMKEITAFQNKVFDTEQDRVKQRAVVVGKMMDTIRGVINTRAQAASGVTKERLRQSSKNLELLYKGLNLAVEEADAQAAGSLGLDEEKLQDVTYKIVKQLQGTKFEVDQASAELMRSAKTNADREEVIRRIEAIHDEAEPEQGLFAQASKVDALKDMMSLMQDAEKKTLDPETLERIGADSSDPQGKEYAELGYEMIMDPDRAARNFIVHQSRIDNTQPSLGGSMGATMAELAGAMSGGSSGTLGEVMQDLALEVGMTDEEAALLSNADRQKEVLLGQLYNPNALPAVVQARDNLLQDEGFKSFKDSMGFKTDRAAFIALRRQFRKDRRKRIKHDRNLLQTNKPKRSGNVSEALNALKQNVRQPTQTVPASSAQAVQPAKPEDTIKTGGTVGGQTGK